MRSMLLCAMCLVALFFSPFFAKAGDYGSPFVQQVQTYQVQQFAVPAYVQQIQTFAYAQPLVQSFQFNRVQQFGFQRSQSIQFNRVQQSNFGLGLGFGRSQSIQTQTFRTRIR